MSSTHGSITHGEIFQQPELWPTTLERVRQHPEAIHTARTARTAILAGAGSSAYAASAIAAAWPDGHAIPTTELLLDPRSSVPSGFAEHGVLVSLARSGDSPESVGVVEVMQRLHPAVRHLAITCNEKGRLAAMPGVEAILLDPRTNDRSLAVTSSFTNVVLAGLCLRHLETIASALPGICARAIATREALDTAARAIAQTAVRRVTVLAPPALVGAAREAALKILEMSDGVVTSLPETILGLRHGPMTYLREDGLVLVFASTDPHHRRYEEDLLEQLRAKRLGRIVVIAPAPISEGLADVVIPATAPDLPDELRAPFEMIFPQLLALHLGLGAGLNPDEPSARNVISHVVQGVRIHGV